MKIIGKTSNGYICEISHAEVRSIMSKHDSRQGKTLESGDELTFTSALERLTLVKDIKLSGDYSTLRKLEGAQEELTKVISCIKGLEIPLISLQKEIKCNTEA